MTKWKDLTIKPYPTLKVSDAGEVRTAPTPKFPNGVVTKGTTGGWGYKYLTVYEPNPGGRKIKRNLRVHRLVAIAFLPNPFNLPKINHRDGCKTNNCVSNLEWCTPEKNARHSLINGLSGSQKLVPADVKEIQKMRASGIGPNVIGAKFNIDPRHVWMICNKKRWAYI